MNAADLVASIGWTLIHFMWQGALIGCASAVALIAMRNARPEQRYTVACTSLLLCLAWPAVDLYQRIAGLDAASAGGFDIVATGMRGAGGPASATIAYLQGQLVWIVGAWALCALALALRMALGLLWIGRAVRRHGSHAQLHARLAQLAVEFGVTREVRLRVVDNLASPITAGWWRPVVLVPASLLSGMPSHLLEALLMHEMAHVKRFDYLVNLGQNVVETLLFFHPAVWWISGRIRVEREQIADDLAARQLGEPRRLALALSELERLQFSTHHLAQAANGGDLMSRIKRLVRPDTQALNWKAAIPVLGLAAAFLAGCAQQPTVAGNEAMRPVTSKAIVDMSSCSKPNYPHDAFKAEKTGVVTLAFLVGTEGNVLDSKVEQSSGDTSLDETAREAIAKCRFKPATTGTTARAAWTQVKYVWTLE